MTEPGDDRLALDLLIRGLRVSRTIRLVADLGVADKIAFDVACPVADSAACGVMPGPLLRALRTLAAFGVVRVAERSGSPGPPSPAASYRRHWAKEGHEQPGP